MTNYKQGKWTLEERNFLINTLSVGGPSVGDLTKLVILGLSQEDQKYYFIDLKKLLLGPKDGLTKVDFQYYINKLLALQTFQYRFNEDA